MESSNQLEELEKETMEDVVGMDAWGFSRQDEDKTALAMTADNTDAHVPGLEDSSMDTDSSSDNAIRKETSGGKKGRSGSTRPLQNEIVLVVPESPERIKKEAAAASASSDSPGSPTSASTGTDVAENRSPANRRSRSKSGAGMFSTGVKVARESSESPEIVVGTGPAKASDGDSVIKSARRSRKEAVSRKKKSKKEGRSLRSERGERRSKSSSRKVVQVQQQLVPDDDDSCDSGSVSTAYSYEDDVVTGFFDGFGGLLSDPFDTASNTYSEDGSVQRDRGSSSSAKNTSLCDISFEDFLSFLSPAAPAVKEPEKDESSATKDDPAEPEPIYTKAKSSQDEASKVPQEKAASADSKVDEADAPSVEDFFDLSFFVELWDAMKSSPKDKLATSDETEKVTTVREAVKNTQPVVKTRVVDREAATLFDDLLDDAPPNDDDAATNDDTSFADLALRCTKSIQANAEVSLGDLQSHYDEASKSPDKVLDVTAETADESQKAITPNASPEATPDKKAAQEVDWQPFENSPFKMEAVTEPEPLMATIDSPLIIKRWNSVEGNTKDSPIVTHAESESVAASLYPPSDAAFESFENIEARDELCACGEGDLFKM